MYVVLETKCLEDTYLDIDIFAPTKSNIVPKKREREESGKHPQTIKPTKRRKLVKIRAEGSLESSSDSEDLDKEENFLERAKSRFRKDAENYNFIDNKTKGEQGKLGEQALNQGIYYIYIIYIIYILYILYI